MTDNRQWHEDRRKGIGGSDVAAIMFLDPRRTPLQVWQEKVDPPLRIERPATRRGKFLEAALIDHYCAKIPPDQIDRAPTIVDGWRRANLDARAIKNGVRAVVEAKTVNRNVFRAEWGEPWTDQVPDRYLCQGYWCAMLDGAERVDFVVAVIPDDPDEVLGLSAAEVIAISDVHVYQIVRRPDVEAAIVNAASTFWTDYVVPRRRPDAWNDEDLARLWPSSVAGKTADLTPVLRDALELFELRKHAKEVDAEIARRAFRVKEHAKDCESLELMGSPMLTFRSQTRAAYTVKETTSRPLVFTKWWDRSLEQISQTLALPNTPPPPLQLVRTEETQP